MSTITRQLRVLIVAPSAKATAVATWLNSNQGANTVPANLGPGLSPTGTGSATYRCCCHSQTLSEALALLNRIAQLANVEEVNQANWDDANKTQKKAMVDALQEAIWTGYGIYFDFSDNQGVWRQLQDAIAFLESKGVSLKRLGEP